MHPVVPISLVFIGCCCNVVFLEFLVREVPTCGNIVTFAQFFFISLEGFIFTSNFGRKKTAIPLSVYAVMVIFFFLVQVSNNYALGFNISMPLHMIFRSGSLVANLLLGVLILKKKYFSSKYFSVLMVTMGIVLCTMATSSPEPEVSKVLTSGAQIKVLKDWLTTCIGIAILIFALLLSAYMGIYQEQVYSKFGKHASEALFYNHALPLPGFLLLSSDIYKHVILFNQSEPTDVFGIGWNIPILWLYLIANIITQYVCIKCVFILTAECTSLTVTLVVTLRKFSSLLFSIWYFNNPFTQAHWIGTCLVFFGTFIFTESYSIFNSILPKKEKSS